MGYVPSGISVVRIFRRDQPVGGGFLIGPNMIATCAHVVNAALNRDFPTQAQPSDTLDIDFPFLPEGPVRGTAVVHGWAPIADDETGDIALLRLDREPPPGVVPPPMRRLPDLRDRRFDAIGFPGGHPDGIWSQGVFRDEQGIRWLQLQSPPGQPRIEPGFSGSPVWDVTSGAVVGISVAAYGHATGFLLPIDQVLALDTDLLPCPFLDMSPFDERHAPMFFGRDAETARLVDAVQEHPVVAATGPSGVGKSSLLRAGLVPRLRAVGHPIVEVPVADPAGRSAALAGPHKKNAVLVLDQFEELAALRPDAARAVLEQVVARTSGNGVRAVLTLRWAALDDVVTSELRAALQPGLVQVTPMSRGALREAITGLAQWSPGLEFEDGLVDRILDDAGAEPGALPLVAALLTELWDGREKNRLTLAAYENAGGVAGAFAAHAERVLNVLDGPATTDTVRRLFLALTRPDRDGRFVRQAVPLTQLPPEQQASLPVLTAQRLLVVTGQTVEPAHQAVIDHWPLLRTWLDENRAFLDWRDRVDAQRAQWEADGKAGGTLLRGATLDQASTWLPGHAADLSPASTDYLRRSHRRQRLVNHRWKMVAATLGVLGLVAATLAAVTTYHRTTIAGHLATANAGVLARESLNRAPTDVVASSMFALAAWRADPANADARTALATSALAMTSVDKELANISPRSIRAMSAGGDTVIFVGGPHPVVLTGVSGPAPRRIELTGIADEGGGDLKLSPDGRLLAEVPPDRSSILIHDLTDPGQVRTLTPAVAAGRPVFSPDGSRLGWLEDRGAGGVTLTVWDLPANAPVPHRLGALPPDTVDVSLTPDPGLVILRTGEQNGLKTRLTTRSLADGAVVAVLRRPSAEFDFTTHNDRARVVAAGASTVSCLETYTVAVTPVGTGAPPAFPDAECSGWISADGGFLIVLDGYGETGPRRKAQIIDLRDGSTREVDLPGGALGDTSGLEDTSKVTVVRTPGEPVVLAAHHGALLRLPTRPAPPTDAASIVLGEGRYVSHRRADTVVIDDVHTGERLGELTGVPPESFLDEYGTSEIVVVRPAEERRTAEGKPHWTAQWTLTRHGLPSLRPIVSFPLPTSGEPRLDGPPDGWEFGIADIEMPDGQHRMVVVNDGVLAVLDPDTGQPVTTPVRLGRTPEERAPFRRAPAIMDRPGHPGQVLLTPRFRGQQLWDVTRGELLRDIGPQRPNGPATFYAATPSPDGKQVVLETPEETIEVWDLDTGTLVGPPLPVSDSGQPRGFDADGHLLVANRAGLRFIDLDTRRGVGTMPTPGSIAGVINHATLQVQTGDFQPELIPLAAEAWRDQLCVVLDRPYRPEELAVLPNLIDGGPPCS